MQQHYRQLAILTEAGHKVEPYISNQKDLQELLKRGIFYPGKRMKCWIDGEMRCCFALYARFLSITNGNKLGYWRWYPDPAEENVEVAKAVGGKWLDVKGSFQTMKLSDGIDYQVSFRVKLDSNTMMGKHVKVRLSLPNGTSQDSLTALPSERNVWTDLKVGSFKMTSNNIGRMDFAMEQYFRDLPYMTGLHIKGVEIKTNTSPSSEN